MSGDACQAHDLYHNCPEEQRKSVTGPEIDFTFTAGTKEYRIKGDMQSIEKKSVGYSPSGTEKITLELWGTVEVKTVHTDPHFATLTSKHNMVLCQCKCDRCWARETGDLSGYCVCPECGC